jgi:hypothetical protein
MRCFMCGAQYRPGEPIAMVDTPNGREMVHQWCQEAVGYELVLQQVQEGSVQHGLAPQ